jgi:hypothetical protein
MKRKRYLVEPIVAAVKNDELGTPASVSGAIFAAALCSQRAQGSSSNGRESPHATVCVSGCAAAAD